MEPAPEIDRVEWLSSSSEVVLVRVHGHRVQPRSDDELRLIVDEAGHRRAFPPDQGVHVNYHTGEWTACFSVPIELRPALEANLALELGGLVLALPAALAGGSEGVGPTADAQVIDRGVLAERRARRAELAEQGLLRRAAEAEAAVDTLQRQLTNLEQRFAKTNEELERLRPRLTQGEAERRRLRQREYAEQQQRLEAEDRIRELEARIAGERDGLRASLRKAEQETQTLAAELERLQRALAEAQHSAASEQANLRRAQEELAARESALGESAQAPAGAAGGGEPPQRVFVRVDSTEERVQALGQQLRSISDHLARREVALEEAVAGEREARDALASERARHDEDLAGLQRRVEELRGELVAAIGLVRAELQAEQAARARAEDDLQAEQEARLRAEGELHAERAAVQRLSDELQAARTEAASTALALGDLPLEQTPTATSETELRRQREEMAEALAAAVARLRARVAEFEQAEPVSAQPPAEAVPAQPEAAEAAPLEATATEAAAAAPALSKPEAEAAVEVAPAAEPAPPEAAPRLRGRAARGRDHRRGRAARGRGHAGRDAGAGVAAAGAMDRRRLGHHGRR